MTPDGRHHARHGPARPAAASQPAPAGGMYLLAGLLVPLEGIGPVSSAPHPLMSCEEVAAVFRVDPKTVSKWGRTGRLATIRTPAGHRKYFREQIDAILAGKPLTAKQVNALRDTYAGRAL